MTQNVFKYAHATDRLWVGSLKRGVVGSPFTRTLEVL